MGGAKQAAAIAGVTPPTVLRWLKQGLIRGERVGGRFRYNLDDIASMREQFPHPGIDVDERIRELVSTAPELSAAQIAQIRLLLHAAPVRTGT